MTVKFIWDEPVTWHTVTYDLNGGYPDTMPTDSVPDGEDLNGTGFLVFGGWQAPAGKSLVGFEIEGEFIRSNGGDWHYYFTKEVTVKFIWDEPVTTPLRIRQQPADSIVRSGQTASVTVGAEGDGLKYQWYLKNPGSSRFTKSSNTTSTYSVKMTAPSAGVRSTAGSPTLTAIRYRRTS